MDSVISVSALTKNYGKKVALNGINLDLSKGKIVGLLGPNGSGKTTLIKLLCGLLQPTSGSVLIDGEAPGIYTKSVISYLPDRMYFADWMTAKDLLDFFSDFYEDFDRSAAETMCAELGLDMKQRMKAMSKGTKEKLQLTVVMSRRAKLFLLDEPIAGVDPAARDYILGTILRNFNREGTVLISTHLIADVEPILDEAVFLKDGNIVEHANCNELRLRTGNTVDAYFREVFRTVPYAPPFAASGIPQTAAGAFSPPIPVNPVVQAADVAAESVAEGGADDVR